MTEQRTYAKSFHALHVKGEPLVLFNIWDAGSARAVEEAGAKALATGSWSVAAAHGFADEERLPLELMLANLQRVARSVELPVSCDIESGYGAAPERVAETVRRTVAAGAVGVNLEDGVIGGGLYPVAAQTARLRAARGAAEGADVPLFINARTDVFLQLPPAAHDESALADALHRAEAYAAAGASGFFAPGLRDAALIQTLCDRSPLPVNIMMLPGAPPSRQLADLGVARISYGPSPYRQVLETLTEAARGALASAS